MQKKVIVKQQDTKDCGACCIQSILKYYDGYASLEKIRSDTFTSNRGTSAFHIVEVFKKYGFDCYGTKIKKERFEKEEYPLPAIVHVVLDNGLNHYMVLYEIRKNNVILMDPNYGKKTMSITDFFWIWSEVIIIMYPKNQVICMPKETPKFLLFWQYLGKEKRSFFKLIFLQLFLFTLTIISSFYLKLELSQLGQKENQILLFLFFLGIMLFIFIVTRVLTLEEGRLNKRLELNHTSSILDHIIKIPLSTYVNRVPNDYLERVLEQMQLKVLYTKILVVVIISIITGTISFLILYFLNTQLFTYYLITIIIYILTQLFFQTKSNIAEKESLESKNRFVINMIQQLKRKDLYTYLNIESIQKEKIETETIIFLKTKYKKERFYIAYSNFYNFLKEGSRFIFLSLGIFFISSQKIKLIDFILIEEIGGFMTKAIEDMIKILPDMRYLIHILKKGNDFYNVEIENEKKIANSFQMGDIKIENLTFSYNQYNYILKDISMEIKEGNHILMMGNSGCGKSTFCKILVGVQKPTYGIIRINNVNLTDYNATTIRQHIVYLPQNSKLIYGTIKENIIMNRSFNLKKFKKICEVCHIEEILAKKPLRFETIISEESSLSGGEKQRIMLARTLYSERDIFLLDESLSEVDEKLEKSIIKAMRIFLEGKTMIYISHKNYKKLFDEMINLQGNNERILTIK